MDEPPVVAAEDLETSFRIGGTWHPALRGVSFTIGRNETLALVGESGCGKSLTALSIMGLLAENCRITRGRILFQGQDLAALDDAAMERLRGDRLSMIFQEPMTSLNPVLTIGRQVAEALRHHRGLSATEARRAALDLLRKVGIPMPEQRFADYPHRFSGGMRQRVMIAMAIACQPLLLIADEPTTALDVTIQSQVLILLAELKAAYGMSMLFITHNLGVVAAIADRVAVMYGGEIVEIATTGELFERPTHPYTEALLRSVPRADRDTELMTIAGQVPPITRMPAGCAFAPRCPLAMDVCRRETPLLVPMDNAPSHAVRCWARQSPRAGHPDMTHG
jgi:peptide/nickel transport system ATP-binding protein